MTSDIEEEKKRLDAEYRQRAQEMKRRCQEQLDALEEKYALSVCFNKNIDHEYDIIQSI